MSAESIDSPSIPPAGERVVSIDALRGFDMFWILGAGSLVHGLRSVSDGGFVSFLADQLEHVAWEGCRFYDIIFPLFVFLMGASTVFSLRKIVNRDGIAAAYRRVIWRAVVLYCLGLLYYGGLSRDGGPETFRYVGVLQRIAICYLAGGILFLNLRFRGLLLACAGLLIGYWALLTFVPVPGHGVGNFAEGKNLANYFDQQYLLGYKWRGDWDPEGLLSNLTAIATGLLGVFAGLLLYRSDLTKRQKVVYLAAAGCGCLLVGWLWGQQFPIIKRIWTSSYVLWTGGWSYLLLALFYLVIDVWNLRRWAQPFIWIGMNPITIYMLANLVGFSSLVRRVVHQQYFDAIQPWGDLLLALLSLLLAIGICYVLYRKRIFIRV
jgi:predicted acyltransferase